MADHEQIDKYLQGELAGEELRQFEERLQKDASFAETVQLYRSVHHEIMGDAGEQHLRRKLSALNKKHAGAKVVPLAKSKRILYFAAAAAIIAVMLTVVLPRILAPENSVEKLFAEITVRDSLPVAVRGSNDKLRADIAQAYNNRDYSTALPLLEQYTSQSADANYNFAKAVCYAEQGNFQRAMNVLDSLAAGASVYKYKALAEKARILYQQGRADEARNALNAIPSGATEYETAGRLLKTLEK